MWTASSTVGRKLAGGLYTYVCSFPDPEAQPPQALSSLRSCRCLCMFALALRRSFLPPIRWVHHLPKGTTATPTAPGAPATNDTSKRPRRGGQNLSERYLRLERSLRQKAVQSAHIAATPGSARPPDAGELPRVKPAMPKVEMFHGFIVPEEPQEPGPDGAPLYTPAACNSH